jgi:hypothetical protein
LTGESTDSFEAIWQNGHANGSQKGRGGPLSTGRVPLAGAVENGVEPPEELEREVILRGRISWVYATAGSGKSWFALWLTMRCVERGQRVLYLDSENGHRIVAERLGALGVSTERLDDLLCYIPFPFLAIEPEVQADYLALLDEFRPDMIVFDSLLNFLGSSGLEENSNDDLVKWAAAFTRPARARGIACLVLDHVSHDGGHARGASRKKDESDAMWALSCPVPFDRDTEGSLVLRRVKDREAWLVERVGFSVGGTEEGFIFRRSDGTLEEPNLEDGLTGTERRTLDALRDDFGEDGAAASEWMRAAKVRKVSEPSFWRAKRAITPPRKVGLVIVGPDSRFRAVPPSKREERDSGESHVDEPESRLLSRLSNDYHDRSDTGTTSITIAPPKGGDSDSADSGQRVMQCDDDRVRELLEAPPPWLVEQLARLREDPDRFAKPTFAAVAAEALGDARRWSEVEPILEEVCR